MSVKEEFISEIQDRYRFKGDKIISGKAVLADEVLPEEELRGRVNTDSDLVKKAIRRRNSQVKTTLRHVALSPVPVKENTLIREYLKKKK